LRARRVTTSLGAAARASLVRAAARDGALHATADLVVAGLGEARRVELPGGFADPGTPRHVAAALRSVALEGDPGPGGTGVLAMGALPFAATAPATLRLPALVCAWRPDGTPAWVTAVGDERDPAGAARRASDGVDAYAAPNRVLECDERPSGADYAAAVGRCVERIAAGELRKAVLARAAVGRCGAPIDAAALAATLHELDPACDCYAYPDGPGRFVGASPELVVATADGAVAAHPLAGTVPLTGDGADEARLAWLLASAKNRAEHALVVEDVLARLAPFCDALHAAVEPSVVRLSTNARLGTWVDGKLAARSDAGTAMRLLAALHPTPAVGGSPRDAALRAIADAEPADRGPWAGPVGWVDADGTSTWTLGLRGVRVTAERFEVWSGAGVVAGSVPDDERAETAEKLASVLRALDAPPPRT
jgi:isochorismate synthase